MRTNSYERHFSINRARQSIFYMLTTNHLLSDAFADRVLVNMTGELRLEGLISLVDAE